MPLTWIVTYSKTLPKFEMLPTRSTYFEMPPTDHLFLAAGPTAVCGRKSGRASLRIPGHMTVLSRTAYGQCVDAVRVTVTVTIVTVATAVTRCPYKDRPQSSTSLSRKTLKMLMS